MLLLGASYFFYGSWKPAYLGLILLTTLVNFFGALLIAKNQSTKKYTLIGTLVFNFGLLFLFKYFDFFSYSLNHAFSLAQVEYSFPVVGLLLPVGISFYTFQTVGYILDVYQNKIKPEKHFGYFALFVSFFPQLVAGPIERSQHLLPQLKKNHRFDYAQTISGLKLFGLGLFKKVVIADNLAGVVNFVFENLDEFKGLSLIIAVVLFSWQIYCDFSGYTDMARGIGRAMGFELMENFNRPYFATSIRDFWRRWHMSLSTWLKDYLYIPLGGSRKGLWRTCLNYLIVFTLCGLWHGAAWTFVIWGALHGGLVSIERLLAYLTKNKIAIPQFIAIAYTYTMVCITWVFFRAQNFADAFYILRQSLTGIKNIVNPNYIVASISQVFVTNRIEMGIVLFCLISILVIDYLKDKPKWVDLFYRQPIFVRYAFYTVFVVIIFHLRDAKLNEFIYFRF